MKDKIKAEMYNHIQKAKMMNGTIGNVIEDYDFDKLATELIKLFAIPVVSNRRGLLIAFAEWMEYNSAHKTPEQCVNEYLKANNCG
jgi:hypothetical protein